MSNSYETSQQKIIPAVLLYAFHENKLLMIHSKKWNGLGGKIELGETPIEAAVREFHEEAHCQTTTAQWTWTGQLYFPNFKAQKKEDWWVSVFACNLNAEQVTKIPVDDPTHREGLLNWVSEDKVLTRELWDGDRHFLPFVFARRPFQGTFFYENGSCVRYEIAEIRVSPPINQPPFAQ
jgi:8-oxo-dGTP diphosphatase